VTKIFLEAAARAPCCILIDNIDLLCYSRTAPGASELQKRIVSCLLTLMDGVSSGAGALPGAASQGNDDRYCDFISV
jgi:SpoVK/Ycf46/Vps4 family AAA+-type ATPase